jgi:hypothetical protein
MRFHHLRRDEQGMSLVFVGLGFMGFLAATTLAVDVGMLMTARSQAQNSADAGALAGAVALNFNSYADRTSSGPAVQGAVNAARANTIMGEVPAVDVGDITFLNDATGQPNRVRVQVFRTGERNNAIRTVMAGFFGVSTANITATATAEATPANAATCVAPFTIPDKWIEKQTGSWDPTDTFNAFPTNPSQLGDIYHGPDQSNYTGYNATTDRGLRLVLKAGSGNNIAPSFYNPLALPASTGASDYEMNIKSCNTTTMHVGELLNAEPGNMVGPTKQGLEGLVELDPSAYWDTAANKVVSSQNPSPRIKIVPIYDPYYYNVGKQNGRNNDLKASNYIGFFIENVASNGDVTGRITPVAGLIDTGYGPTPVGAFARAIRLVQ